MYTSKASFKLLTYCVVELRFICGEVVAVRNADKEKKHFMLFLVSNGLSLEFQFTNI